MKTDTTKDIWVNVSELPRTKRNYINWSMCYGIEISFKYYNQIGTLLLLDYIKKDKKIYVKYLDNEPYLIRTQNLTDGKLGFCIKYNEFNYNINDLVHTKNGLCKIIDRRIVKNKYNQDIKEYFCKCTDCGYTYWKTEYRINSDCLCCLNKIVVQGINDIPTTAPWMIKYFQGGYDEAKLYSKNSGKSIYPICPDCGRIRNKKIIISSIYHTQSIGCSCSDGISYPNKFSRALLEQLPIKNWETEYSPLWISPKRYDNYFEYQGKKYILEMDGGFHYIDINSYDSNYYDIQSTDKYKDEMAKIHDITVIRINCFYSDCISRFQFIKNNIIKSEIGNIFNLNNIDWNKCDNFAISNMIKLVCDYWMNNNKLKSDLDICKKFNISYCTLYNYLKIGAQHNWCNYNSKTNHLTRDNKK